VIVEKGEFPVNSVTIPDSVVLKFIPGGTLNVQYGATLTVYGAIEASPNQQIFTGTGTIDLSHAKIDKVYPEWFGASSYVPSGGSPIDNATPIQKAINSISAGVIQLSSGDYRISQPLILKGAVKLQGVYGGYEPVTRIYNDCSAGTPAVIVQHATDYSRGTGVYDISIWAGTNVSGIGLLVEDVRFCDIQNIGLQNFTSGFGMVVSGDTTNSVSDPPGKASIGNRFEKVYIANCKTGLQLKAAYGSNDGSSDEGLYSNFFIQVPVDGLGVWIQRSMANTFIRLSINHPFTQDASVGIKFDDFGADSIYSPRDHIFLGTTIECINTPVIFSPKSHGNRFESIHIYNPFNYTTGGMVIDSSGGGNFIGSVSSGEGLGQSSSWFIPSTLNLLNNDNFENWTNNIPDYWFTNDTSAIAKSATGYFGNWKSALTFTSGSPIYLQQTISDMTALKGKYASFGCWVKTTCDSANLFILTDQGYKQGLSHPGDNEWHYLTVRYKIPANATVLQCAIRITNQGVGGGISAYADGAFFSASYDVPVYVGKGAVGNPPIIGMLQFDGASNAYPGLKNYSGALEVRTAGDSAYADLHAKQIIATGGIVIGSPIRAPLLDSLMLSVDLNTMQFYTPTGRFDLPRYHKTVTVTSSGSVITYKSDNGYAATWSLNRTSAGVYIIDSDVDCFGSDDVIKVDMILAADTDYILPIVKMNTSKQIVITLIPFFAGGTVDHDIRISLSR
jgi:hypothetical protein